MDAQFVTAFNGARDDYELPLALAELGLLRTHVSDAYCPDFCVPYLSMLPGKLSLRRRAGLSSRAVHVDLNAAFHQFVRKPPLGSDPYYNIDRSISLTAAKIARRTGSDLFLHNQYAYWAFSELPDRRRYLYQFHPHGATIRVLLERDFEHFPEVRWSFENEQDSLPVKQQRQEGLEEWKMADGIVCASSFTKKSLVMQGCEPERVHVVPYGASSVSQSTETLRSDGRCRFLFVGQGVQRKGLHHLLRAWKKAALIDTELVVVARRIDPGIKPLLDAPGVRYLPGVSGKDLEALYRMADIFVMPSIVEGFGLVYLEALARGLHCIGSTNTGLPDLRLNDRAVSYIQPGDIDELAASLAQRAEDVFAGRISKVDVAAAIAPQTWDFRRAQLRDTVRAMITG